MFVDIFHIDDAFKDYVLDRLFPLFKLKIGECRAELPLIGKKSCVRFLKTSSGAGYAIRAFARSRLKEARRLSSAQELLFKEGIPVPRIVDFSEKFSSKGVCFLTEEYLPGETWETIDPSMEMAKNLGELLYQLHRLESRSWGSLVRPVIRWGGFGDSQFRLVKNRLHRVRKFLKTGVPSSEFREIRVWFRKFIKPMNEIEVFQMIHNKINRGNVIASPDKNKMSLVDFATLQYGAREKDIIQAESILMKDDKDLVTEFEKEYFSRFNEEVKNQYDALSIFYRAYYHLSASASNIRRDYARRGRNNERSPERLNFVSHWKALLDIVRELRS